MTCVACKSNSMREGTTTITVERGTMILVIRRVPAHVCEQCGEEYIAGEVHEQLEKLVDRAEGEGVQFAVRDFAERVPVG